MAPIALYPDPLLAKILIAATYPLEVDEAARWLAQHNSPAGATLDREAATQPWDDSINDLARVPTVLSMMDGRLKWTQNLGDTFLARPDDVFQSVQRLRKMALRARTLHSTSQQKVTRRPKGIDIEPTASQNIYVPFYDPRVVYGVWPDRMHPPMWWTAPRGYSYGTGIAFMTAISVPAIFWKDTMDWDSGEVRVSSAVRLADHDRAAGVSWIHDPVHRRFVSYSTPQLRLRYGRSYATDRRAGESIRGYDVSSRPLAVPGRSGREAQIHLALHDTRPKQALSAFEDIDQGARERMFSRRGNASMLAARRDSSRFSVGELAASIETDTIAAR